MFGGISMLRCFLMLSLVLPVSGYCQSYADSPFYQPVAAVPSTAHSEGYRGISANGIVIDLSEWVPESSLGFDRIAGWSVAADVDGTKPAQVFHYYTRYDHMNPVVVFGYNLLAEPVEGTDQIRCTFSALTNFEAGWLRNKEVAPVAFPASLTPVVIHSGDVLAIKTLPLGPGKIAAVHYLRLIRADQTADSTQ
jgi:hypothetical protein